MSRKLSHTTIIILLALFLLPSLCEAAISFIYPVPKSWVKRSDYLIVKLNNLEITGVTISATVEQFEGSPEQGNPCYTCHRSMMNVPFVHGPAGTYTCVYCHALQGERKYAVPKRDAESCLECHADKAAEFKKRKYLHGPIDAGMCEICHDPHGSAYPAQLRAPVNDLCLSCHDKIANEFHATRTPRGKGHPLKAKEDLNPQRKGKEFTCVSCHLPHAADVRYYYRSNEEEKMRLCQMCHNY